MTCCKNKENWCTVVSKFVDTRIIRTDSYSKIMTAAQSEMLEALIRVYFKVSMTEEETLTSWII